jgi:hypothetical protein
MSVQTLVAADAVAEAATAALLANRPAEAWALLEGYGAPSIYDDVRLVRLQAAWELGKLADVEVLCGDDITQWPGAQRGAAAWIAGQYWAAQSRWDRARVSLLAAIDRGGPESDPALDLLAEVAFAQGDRAFAQRSADLRWRRMPRTASAAHAGLLLAALLAENDPSEARVRLAQVRALPGLPDDQAVQAAEQMCRLLLVQSPTDCLLVAEGALAEGMTGRLPLWRARALLAIDRQAGADAVMALPAGLRDDPLVADFRPITKGSEANPEELAFTLGRADVIAGRYHEAVARLQPFAAKNADILALLLALPGVDPGAWEAAPAAASDIGGCALAESWLLRGRPEQALRAVAHGCEPSAALWTRYWAWRCLCEMGDARALPIEKDLQKTADSRISGEAWVGEASRLGATAAASQAWLEAARRLPDGHPWLMTAIEAALRGGMADLVPAPAALEIAQRLPAKPLGEDAERCRFLEAQISNRTGNRQRVCAAVASLLPGAQGERRMKLLALLSSAERERLVNAGDTP